MSIDNMTFDEVDKLSEEEQRKLYNAIPEEEKEILRQKTEMLTKALPHALIARNGKTDLISMGMLGGISMEYCEKFKCSPMQFIQELKILEKVFIEQSIKGEGISFNEKVYKIPDKLKKKNRENHKAIEKEDKKSMGNQMADALKRAGVVKE